MASADVLIIGGGPAGLAAAIELRRLGVRDVAIVDREPEMGGIPRHAHHIGFGLRDLKRVLRGPVYARRYVRLAADAGADLRGETTATEWLSKTTLRLTSARGLDDVEARAVLLATGCRERPRSARLVPGDRPLGVFTTGSLQQLVHLRGHRVGRSAIVVGAEHVSFSAVLTLAHAGVRTLAMVTEHARHQSYAPYKWLSADRLRVPILTSHRLSNIEGRERVAAVELTDLRTNATRRIKCDTVVFTGDWIPDHELARRGGLMVDAATQAPRVDGALRTSQRGVFAAGNLVHAAETADIAALGGRHAARCIQHFLRSGDWPANDALPINCDSPVQWVSPSAVRRGDVPPRDRFIWRVSELVSRAELTIRQGDRILWRRGYRRLVPTLPLSASAAWIDLVDPAGPPIAFGLNG